MVAMMCIRKTNPQQYYIHLKVNTEVMTSPPIVMNYLPTTFLTANISMTVMFLTEMGGYRPQVDPFTSA